MRDYTCYRNGTNGSEPRGSGLLPVICQDCGSHSSASLPDQNFYGKTNFFISESFFALTFIAMSGTTVTRNFVLRPPISH